MEKGQNNLMYVSGVVNTAKRIGWAVARRVDIDENSFAEPLGKSFFFPLNEIMQILSS